uniref:ThiF domain-containing protein n=1 Tax=Panagrellus redivivus TaxID=6233 RepID=A0A7E4W2K8_PANRE
MKELTFDYFREVADLVPTTLCTTVGIGAVSATVCTGLVIHSASDQVQVVRPSLPSTQNQSSNLRFMILLSLKAQQSDDQFILNTPGNRPKLPYHVEPVSR